MVLFRLLVWEGVKQMNRRDRQRCLETLKQLRRMPDLEYGMYVEVYSSNQVYSGTFVETDGEYICLHDGFKKSMPFHPTWQTVYYNNPVEKKIIYDFREQV